MVNTILKEADLFCPNSVRINFTIYLINVSFHPIKTLLNIIL
ncbi:ABC transporter ATP-binding protein [Latilactobacillus sakei]|nr:ABC transporter ATP-binding protein [Latilactobacillus sakei]